MLDAGTIILLLKMAVVAVTLLLTVSLTALAHGNVRLHGRLNIAFFALTLGALLGVELVARVISPGIFNAFLVQHDATSIMRLHLKFAVPSAGLMFLMLFTGLCRFRSAHMVLGVLFLILWTGTFITGVFFLPHHAP